MSLHLQNKIIQFKLNNISQFDKKMIEAKEQDVYVLWAPFSVAFPNYEVVGFQPQAVSNPEPRIYKSHYIHFHVRDEMNEGQTIGTVFSFLPVCF